MDIQFYQLQQSIESLVSQQLTQITPLSLLIIALAGLLTSLTPCMLSMLPVTIAYMGGYQLQGKLQATLQSFWFVLGLATTLSGLGIVSAGLGKVYGQIGIGLPIFVSIVAILMGLNLLELIPLQLPNWGGTEWISEKLPSGLRSYLFGLTFGLVASPCSTPVLATLLAWVSQSQDLKLGGCFLFVYALGYVSPLVLAGIFTASIKQLLALRKWSGWINPISGALLIGFGVFSLLSRFNFGI